MRAIRHHEFGPPDVLVLEEVPDPDPGSGQVGIAVEAAGVHVLDTSLRAGVEGTPSGRSSPLPARIGCPTGWRRLRPSRPSAPAGPPPASWTWPG